MPSKIMKKQTKYVMWKIEYYIAMDNKFRKGMKSMEKYSLHKANLRKNVKKNEIQNYG